MLYIRDLLTAITFVNVFNIFMAVTNVGLHPVNSRTHECLQY